MRISEYTIKLAEALASGHAREHSYRPALKDLFSSFPDALAVNEPKRSEFGSPDFIIISEKNHDIVLGHAEAKDINVSLDKIEKSEQMRRYSGYPKIILTNGLEFRFFENGDKYETVIIGVLKDSIIDFDETQYDRLSNEISAFLQRPPESIRSGKRLAQIMGDKARRVRDNVVIYLQDGDIARSEELRKIYEMMTVLLVHDLTEEKFADMYAQTLVYGLFVARYGDKTLDSFTRQEARDLVPKSNPFLQKFFDHIAGPDFDIRLGHIVDELCAVFMVSDVQMLVHKHLRILENNDEKDPIIHFYEDFLKEYDPVERKKMGAYYTPLPVVRFIVREVDRVLKEEFNITNGLSDTEKKTIGTYKHSTKQTLHRVQILDPAVGTATFLNEIIKYIHTDFKGQEGRWESYVKEDLLPRLYGFELMMAPYTIAHLKLGMMLQETGVKDLTQRIGVYLTNTLEEGLSRQVNLDMAFGLGSAVAEEASQAGVIKHERPIMVIMGNPPYSGVSSNETKYANNLIAKYKVEPGGAQKLQERKHWLNDDYVKFIAFAEDVIANNGEGIVSMITNNGYLDNPTFRGMRWHLAKTFDKIYILDLHGNSKKKESAPDGGKDENVFDIQQGVGIIIAVKTGKKPTNKLARVFYAEIYGDRKSKFNILNHGIEFNELLISSPSYYLKPKNTEGESDFNKGIKLDNIFIKNTTGIVTGIDKLSIFLTPSELKSKTSEIIDTDDPYTKYEIKDSRRVSKEERLAELIEASEGIPTPVSYRPFDIRYMYYTKKPENWINSPRFDIMQNFINHENLALVAVRQYKTGDTYQHAFISTQMAESSLVSNRTSEIGYEFPLYLYDEGNERYVNFVPNVLAEFTKNLNNSYSSEDIIDYIYAVLHSPNYRKKYKEFLKIDFPRIPIPTQKTFNDLKPLGKQLRELHLMTSLILNENTTTFPESGSNIVEEVKYWVVESKTFWKDDQEPIEHKANTVTINKNQYFGNVPETAWNFRIGGYQPAQKWLKDRKNRKLTSDEIVHYERMIKVLIETDRIMNEIDTIWTP